MTRKEAMREVVRSTLMVTAPTIDEQKRRIATAGADAAEARIVAWLREQCAAGPGRWWAADAIERGEHWPDA